MGHLAGQDEYPAFEWQTLVDANHARSSLRAYNTLGKDSPLNYNHFNHRVLTGGAWCSYGVSPYAQKMIPAFDSKGDSKLFHKFAKLNPTEDAILKFACKHGLLGADVESRFIYPLDDPTITASVDGYIIGDSFYDWVNEISAMRAALSLYSMIVEKDTQQLQHCISWSNDQENILLVPSDDFEYYKYKLRLSVTGTIYEMPVYTFDESIIWCIEFCNREKHLKLARAIITSMMNKRLMKYVAQSAEWNSDNIRMTMHPHPLCLLGLVWMQFLHAITTTKGGVTCYCEGCKRPFAAKARNAKWCSPGCRKRVQRSKGRGEE